MKILKLLGITFFSIIFATSLSAQTDGSFTMELSRDTVLLGNTVKLSYSIENMEGEFVAPELDNFRVVSGPNVSSQFSSINGKVSQKSSYNYLLLPQEEGIGKIGTAKIGTGDEWIELDPVDIIVLDNPHGIQGDYGYSPRIMQSQKIEVDTLSPTQKKLMSKLKKGKRRKI